jgi:hypothetical protein
MFCGLNLHDDESRGQEAHESAEVIPPGRIAALRK